MAEIFFSKISDRQQTTYPESSENIKDDTPK